MRPPLRRLFAVGVAAVLTLSLTTACTDPLRVSPADRRAITDSLSALVKSAYDFAQPDPATRLLGLYPDSGRVISAVAGRVTTTRDSLARDIAGLMPDEHLDAACTQALDIGAV